MNPSERIPEWTMGDRMRKAREVAGLDQRAFAERLGVSRQTVTNAEKGHVGVRKITIKAWAMATGVPAAWLETGAVPDGPDDGGWAPRGSNPQPADYPFRDALPAHSRAWERWFQAIPTAA